MRTATREVWNAISGGHDTAAGTHDARGAAESDCNGWEKYIVPKNALVTFLSELKYIFASLF